MRKLIMWNLVTLDGYFEGEKPWDLDWHGSIWGPELERLAIEQLGGADMLLFGRVTYEGMAAHWRTAEGEVAGLMNRLPKVVVSRTLGEADWANTTLVKDDAAAAVRRLKREGDRDILVFGSADLSATLIDEDLFDEYRLAVAPVVLGHGTSLFGRNLKRKSLTLVAAKPLSSGGVILRYAPVRPAAA